MTQNTSTTTGSTTVANTVAAVVTAVSTITITGFGVMYTTPFITEQFIDPIVGGGIGTLASIAILTLGVTIGVLFATVVVLGIINTYAEPRAFGQTEYGIFSKAGVAGAVGVLAFQGLMAIPGITAPAPTIEHSVAATAITAIPLALMFRQIEHESDTTSATQESLSESRATNPDVPKSEPVDWDRDPPETLQPSDGTGNNEDTNTHPGREHGMPDEHTTETTADDDDDFVDYSDMEFEWRTKTDVSFDDVGGMEDTKSELQRDIVKPLTTGKDKADEFGIPVPNLLFHGPPGTGKTFLAKALATELGLPFAKLSGAEVQSKWINESAQKVNSLFTEAKRIASKEGGAVVFIDELDSVLRDRGDATNSHAEDQKVVNEFLNQLQDLDEYDIVFIGATNRPDILDEAGTRSGRIDKKIEVGVPDAAARRKIIETLLDEKPNALDESDIDTFVQRTDGLVAADLHSIVMEAARESAFGRDDDEIRWQDVSTALDNQ